MDIEEILKESGTKQKDLIPILYKIQAACGRIPHESISAVARHLRLSESEVFGVLTFNQSFTLELRGTARVLVCQGTACHVRGADRIVEAMERKLGISVGRTTEDKTFSLEKTRCLGCCAVGPVVVVNETQHVLVSPQKVDCLLDKAKTPA